MKTPANPLTIHVIAPQEVIPYVAPRRPSRVSHVRPSLAETLTRTGHGVVQTSRLARFVVTQLFRMIVLAGVGSVHGVRFLYRIALTWLLFVFIRVPLFLLALCFLMFTIACGWEILDALYRG
jgi:hypothetical protein